MERLTCNRLHNFLGKHEVIFLLQFWFQLKYSTTDALIHLTDNLRNEIEGGKYACRIFVDFQIAFKTVNHYILLKKFEHYEIRENADK